VANFAKRLEYGAFTATFGRAKAFFFILASCAGESAVAAPALPAQSKTLCEF